MAWPLHPEDDAVVGFAHHRKFHQVMRLAIHIRAHVEQHGGRAFWRWGRPGRWPAGPHLRVPRGRFWRWSSPRRCAGADHAIRLALMHQTCRNADGESRRWRKALVALVVHGDRLTGVDDLDGETLDFPLAESFAETIFAVRPAGPPRNPRVWPQSLPRVPPRAPSRCPWRQQQCVAW